VSRGWATLQDVWPGPEKFELAVAAQGAREAGGFLWKWA